MNKRNLRPIVLIAIVAFSLVNLHGQVTQQTGKPYSSLDGLYSVTVPEGIRVGGGGPLEAAFTEGFGYGYSTYWVIPDLRLQAGYMQFRKDRVSPVLEERQSSFVRAVARLKQLQSDVPGFEFVHEKKLTVNKVPAIELAFKDQTREVVYRLFHTEAAIVRLMAIVSLESQEKQRAMSFLDSLEAPPKDQIIAQKISNATPEPLPDCPVDLKIIQDTVDHGLNGKVDSVLLEREETEDGKTVRYTREESYFDRSGRLVRSIDYDGGGRPSSVQVYGCIDGKRVWKSGHVPYENVLTGMAPSRPGAKPRDPRYTTAYELEADSRGRILKSVLIGNDSLVYRTTKRLYSENRVEITTTDDDGRVVTKIIEELDRRGLPESITRESFGSNGWVWKNTFKVSAFDSTQNWTRRSGVYERIVKGVIEDTESFQEFRTIKYFK